jgi:hypothetical protein
LRIVEPVVVYPETLSNHALISVNSPPQRTYGSIPKIKESSHDSTMVRKPSLRERVWDFLMKIKGKPPTISVMMKLMRSGPNAESLPLTKDTIMDRNMKRALTRRAFPTFIDIAFTFMSDLLSDV